ncbi:WAP four-disulfide core domain protein 6 [Bubalus bubalis]|uniref:WAP four-disulfide core domain protein 6 n=1 Tax=Bubalus bubalis TaxID=89462 RepID=UPI001D127BEE|nr:WAP four-disulfide core domain protein 6 [Bubalus bubalis]
MGFLGVLPILILFILLRGVQEPGLVEAFFLSKYQSKYQGKNFPPLVMVSWPWEGRAPAPSRFQVSISFCPSGHCPRNRVRCEIQERDLCTNSRDCPKKMKCCQFSCGKKCLDIDKGNSPIPWVI